jgi:RimJ/RimL family protein N-acetyltransferase
MVTELPVSIRPYRPSDASALYQAAMESIREVRPFMPWCRSELSEQDQRAWIDAQIAASEARTAYEFAIVSSGDRYLGGCGLNQIDVTNRRANLGYWVRSSAAGAGVATAAVQELVRWAFAATDLIRLELVISTENAASLRTAEKAGAHREGLQRNRLLLHGKAHDAAMFSFVRPEDLPG